MHRCYQGKFSFYILLSVLLVGLCCAVPTELFPGPIDKKNETMTLAALGDCIIARKISVLKDHGFLRLVKLIRQADCTWANCEVNLVDPNAGYPEDNNDVVIACEPWGADEFKWLGIDFVGLANNHIKDYGYVGMFSTIDNLKRVGIGYAGAGKDLEDASRPRYVDTAAGRVGQVSCAFWFPKGSNATMPHPYLKGRPGLNPLRFKEIVHLPGESFAALLEIDNNINRFFKMAPPGKPPKELQYGDFTFVPGEKFNYEAVINEKDFKRIIEAVGIARRNARIVIVSIHQHMGFTDAPLYSMEKFARACIDQGADAVFGTGPHRLWGIEIYKNKPIFYSLGNFLFHGGSFGAYPAETYERFGLPSDTRDTIVFEEELLKKIPYFTNDFLFESMVPVITYEKGNQVTGIKLYPIHFEKDIPLYQQGTPLLAGKAKGESIIKKLVKLSQRYGTKIVFREGVGMIEL